MGTKIQFTPLYGALGSRPLSYLLEIDALTILLDCGLGDSLDSIILQPVLQVLPKVDIILLSHCSLRHLGALPVLLSRPGVHAQVYATAPVYKLGILLLHDVYQSVRGAQDLEGLSLEEIDQAFRSIRQLKNRQFVRLQGVGAGYTLAAFAAGHTVGGAVWRISTPVDEHVVYAPDTNHQREAHLNAGMLDKVASRPAVLICGCSGPAAGQPSPSRKDRERGLIDAVKRTLRSEGNVLIPVDAVGRLLEIVLLLDGHWAAAGLTYPLALLTHAGGSTLEAARSQLEWMSDALSRDFGTKRDNPFACRRVRILHSLQEAQSITGPRIVLASLPSLDYGYARHLFAQWAASPRNHILFPTPPLEGTFAFDVVQASRQRGAAHPLNMRLARRVELEGEELDAWQQAQHERLLQADEQSNENEAARDVDMDDAAASTPLASRTSTSSIARMARPLHGSMSMSSAALPGDRGNAALAHEVQEVVHPAANPDVLLDGFSVPQGCVAPMFPDEDMSEDDAEWDDFGCPLKPSDFALAGRLSLAEDETGGLLSPKGIGDALRDPTAAVGEEGQGQEDETEDPPSKIVAEDITVELQARVTVLGFNGRSDAKSLTTILGNVAPRHLILVNGSEQATAALQKACGAELEGRTASVQVPAVGQRIDASTGSSAFHALLSEKLLTGLSMRPMGGYHIAWLNAVAAPPPLEGQPMELIPGQPSEQDEAYIVDERLSEVAAALAKAGIAAEWAASSLVMCKGQVIVRRGAAGSNDLLLQGNLCPDFYRVQAVIRAQYHIC